MAKNKNVPVQWFGLIGGVVALILFLSFVNFAPEHYNAKIVASIAILMAVWWITEAVPLSVTSLVPLVLFPLFGVVSGAKSADSYMNSTIFLFMGGFIIAIAMERWNLHKRIALNVIGLAGKKASSIVMGFMIASAFISMWISNTATAVMVLPIGMAIIYKLEEEFGREKTKKFSLALMLGIAYSCSIGGISTLIGTPPNLVFMRVYKISFPNNPEILFGDWMKFALPIAIVMLVFVWVLLTKILYRSDKEFTVDGQIIRDERKKLGKISFEEKAVLIVFIATSLLWIFRVKLDLGFATIPGWSSSFPNMKFIDDGTVAITMAVVLFMIPTRSESVKGNFLLDHTAIKKIPWDIILLFGGGFALAEGFVSSGLSEMIGQQFTALKGVNVIFIIAAICTVITYLTELTSNTATAQIVLPILASLAGELQLNPLLVMIPATISASFAFMLPVGTPPNAIVFSSERLRIIDMAKSGMAINIFGIIAVTFFVYMFFA